MELSSTAFAQGGDMARRYSCEGEDIAPDATGLPEGGAPLPGSTREGLNDWKRTGYGGPCPPIGRHRYFFKLYALDTALPDLHRPTQAMLEQAMRGHVLDHAELVATYQKHGG